MKKVKYLLSLVVVFVLVMLALAACAPKREQEDDYVVYTLSNVVMTQKGINTYKFDFDVDSGSEDIKVYFTERDRIKATDKPIEVSKTSSGENAHVTFTLDLQLSEEYYLWVIGNKEVVLPITVPSMFPSLERTSGGVMFHFNYSYDVSWSSFCDPTGRAVYSSNSAQFDSTATVLRENIVITEQEYIIPENEFDENKFYYSVTTAKNGLLKIISAPITMSDDIFEQIDAISVDMLQINGVPSMKLTVTPAVGSELATSQMAELQLFVKNDIGDEIYSTTPVFNNGMATYVFDCSQLIIASKWYDVCLAYRGSMIGDVPVEFKGNDIGTGRSVSGANDISYKLANWEGQLKVYYEYAPVSAFDLCDYTVEFDVASESLIVTVSKIFGNNPVPTLAITAGSTEPVLKINYTSMQDGSYVYRLKLNTLSVKYNPSDAEPTWYDIRLFFDGICAELGKDAVKAGQFDTPLSSGGRVYYFKDYNGLLKIMCTE